MGAIVCASRVWVRVQKLKYGWKISGVMRPRWFISAECSVPPAHPCTHVHSGVWLWQLVRFLLIACQLKASETVLSYSQSSSRANWFKFQNLYLVVRRLCAEASSTKLRPDVWISTCWDAEASLWEQTGPDNHRKAIGREGKTGRGETGRNIERAWETDAGSPLAH